MSSRSRSASPHNRGPAARSRSRSRSPAPAPAATPPVGAPARPAVAPSAPLPAPSAEGADDAGGIRNLSHRQCALNSAIQLLVTTAPYLTTMNSMHDTEFYFGSEYLTLIPILKRLMYDQDVAQSVVDLGAKFPEEVDMEDVTAVLATLVNLLTVEVGLYNSFGVIKGDYKFNMEALHQELMDRSSFLPTIVLPPGGGLSGPIHGLRGMVCHRTDHFMTYRCTNGIWKSYNDGRCEIVNKLHVETIMQDERQMKLAFVYDPRPNPRKMLI